MRNAPIAVENAPSGPSADTLKGVVAALVIACIGAPVGYAAYEINDLSGPGAALWRWPIISMMAAAFGLLAWWVVNAVNLRFPGE